MLSNYRAIKMMSEASKKQNTTSSKSDTNGNKYITINNKIHFLLNKKSDNKTKHCLEKDRSIISYTVTSMVFNLCYLETHQILNNNFKDIRINANIIIEKLKSFIRNEFNIELLDESISKINLTQIICDILEQLVENGTNTLRIKGITSAMFNTLISEVLKMF